MSEEKKEKKACLKQLKVITRYYDDSTVVIEEKEISDGAAVLLEKRVTQDKLMRKKNGERNINYEIISSTYFYDDGSKLNQTREYEFSEEKEKKMVKDLVTSFK